MVRIFYDNKILFIGDRKEFEMWKMDVIMIVKDVFYLIFFD